MNEIYSEIPLKGYDLTCDPDPAHIEDSKIRFELNNVYFYQNSDFNAMNIAIANSIELAEFHFDAHPEARNSLNHLFTEPPEGQDIDGAWGRYFVADGEGLVHTETSMYDETFVVWDDHINHWTHEYGHALGVHHTYDSEYRNTNHYDFLDDIFGTCPEPVVSEPGGLCYEGCNPPPDYICYLKGCFWDLFPGPYPLLSGKWENKYISPKMTGRFHRALSLYDDVFKINNKPVHRYVKEEYPYFVDYEVNQNETWDFAIKMYQNILIRSGNELRIKCHVKMPINGKIMVEPGAKVVIDGGVITSAHSQPWQGIEVWGNHNALQTPSNQGVLELKNDAVIENARNAVTLWKPGDWSKTGGIIKASNSEFRNNKRSVEFMAFQNVQGNGYIGPNRSYFRDCDFVIDEDYLLEDEGNFQQITMYKVNGVRILGCDFIYDRPVSSIDQVKQAIFTSDANFTVDNYCLESVFPGDPCPEESIQHSTFTGYDHAVHVTGAEWNVGPEIKDAVFSKNMVGIHFDAVIAPSATFNNFTVGNNDYPPEDDLSPLFHLGIHTNNCDEYILEENTVEGNDINGFTTHGIYVYDDIYSANSNQIYRNIYEGVESATIASGLHADPNDVYSYTGLKFICNSNVNNTNDFEVRGWGENVDFSEINNFQDDGPGTSAGNSFSAGSDGDGIYTHLDFYSNVTYEYNFDPGSTDPNEDEIYIPSPATIELMEANIASTCETNFPEEDGKIDVVFQLGKFSVNKEEFNNLYYTYLQLIDEGNTVGMITEIDLTWPEDAWDLHAELMSRSPYNSESVLMAAADKNVLTHGMLLEILLANPDALRSGTVINHVENNIVNPLPAYMIEILYLAARNPQTVRTEMERNLSSLHQEKVSSHKHLVNHYLNDTIIGFHPDTLINWFSQIRNLSGRYQQIFAYTGVNQYDNAFAVIDSMETNYKLSNKQYHELGNTEEFVSFLKDIYHDGRNVAQLTTGELSDLEQIANEVPGGIAAERAENILCFHYNICAEEQGAPKSNGTKSRRAKVEDPEELYSKLTDLRVKPNPADQYVELEYEVFESSKENILRVFDTNGRLIEMWSLGTTAKGIKVLDTRELPNGVYYFEIVQDTKQLKSGKFMVQH